MSAAIWQRILDALEKDIAKGRYRAGDKLPTEAELAARFAVNRHTVRRALAALSEAGRIHVRRGSGAYVTAGQVDYRIGNRTRFSQNIAAFGRQSGRLVHWVDTIACDTREAEHLGLEPGGPVHVAEATGEADGVPIVFARSVFPAERLPGLPAALREMRSITRALASCGIDDYERLWTRLVAERARPEIARHLQMNETQPLLRTESLNVDPEGAPLEYSHAWFCSDRVQLVIDRQSFQTEDR